MKYCKFLALLISLMLLLVACSMGRIAEQIAGGPQSAAGEAFEAWAKRAGVPYEDVRYETLSDDGTFSTVRVTAFLRQSAEADWQEMQADVECRKVGGKWQCQEYFYFTLSEAERQRIGAARNATATVVMATRVAEEATATAERQGMNRATETAQAGATATAFSFAPPSGMDALTLTSRLWPQPTAACGRGVAL